MTMIHANDKKQVSSPSTELAIAFQPIASVTPQGIVVYGYEALARTAAGACPPLLLSSRPSQKMYAMDFSCQRLALATAAAIDLRANLSINVTPGGLCHSRYGIRQIAHFAQEIGFPLNRIILEITEREMVLDYKPLRRCIDEYRQDGLRIALDDFGTGFNGLKTLLELRPDIIKIDTALIQKIETDRDRQALLFGICSGGARLGMRLIAEGVETFETLEILSRENIDLMQGYLFARPGTGLLPMIPPAISRQVVKVLSDVPHPASAGDMTGVISASVSYR